MPFIGIATFAGAPYVRPEELQRGQADFAVIGVPFDAAVGFRPGQRLAPRAIRDLSTRYALPWGPDNPGYWDVQDDRWYLQGCRLVDLGDADPLYTDLDHLDSSVALVVGAALRAGAVPVVLGGDHSVTYPVLRAYAPFFGHGRKLHILQIDAHLDFTDRVAGFLRSNSSPFRRAAELPYIGSITVVGIRGIRTNPEAYAAAVARGNRIVTMRELRAGEVAEVVNGALAEALAASPSVTANSAAVAPEGNDGPNGQCRSLLYISIDVDGLDPAVAPGTSSPEPGGLTYEEVRGILRVAGQLAQVVGIDVVEVNPYLDVGGVTSLLAARLAIEAMAYTHRSA